MNPVTATFKPRYLYILWNVTHSSAGFRPRSPGGNGMNRLAISLAVLSTYLLFSIMLAGNAAAASCVFPEPGEVRGLYLPVKNATNPIVLERFVALAKTTEINALVIDLNESGNFLQEHHRRVIARLREECIYTVGRWVVFKADAGWFIDSYGKSLPDNRASDLLLRDKSGKLWRDGGGYAWLNPLSAMVWKIAVDMAIYAADFGFDEVQFDYVRFPTDARKDQPLSAINFGAPMSDKIRVKAIADFLAYAQKRLLDETPALLLGADFFGESAIPSAALDSTGNGQNIRLALPYVDRISPMVYPSHWAPGRFGCPIPAWCPEIVVRNSLRELMQYARKHHPEVQVCPYLQDFSAKNWATNELVRYGPDEVRAQIRTAELAGAKCWFLWNPSLVHSNSAMSYSISGLRPKLWQKARE